MNKIVSFSALFMVGYSALSAGAAPVSRPLATLRSIRANAVEAGQNAGIYQWVRVNREVDRIVADTRKVEKTLASEPGSAATRQSLQQAVSAIRAGRLHHDVSQVQNAARQIAEITDALLK